MAELETGPPDEKVLEEQTEHIARLHKMSTTAGIATAEYVAINNTAIAAAVLGLMTLLALVHWTFLALGVAGVVCGIIAFIQIRDSNGTQGGKGIAIAGILLSLVISGLAIAMIILDVTRKRQYEQQIQTAVAEVGQHLKQRNYDAAYQLLSPAMKQRVTLERWRQFWAGLNESYGNLTRFEGNNIVQFIQLTDGTWTGLTQLILSFEQRGEETARLTMYLSEGADGKWQIHRIVEPFEGRAAQAPPPSGSPGAAPVAPTLPGMGQQ